MPQLTLREVAEKVNKIIHKPRTEKAEAEIKRLSEENGFTFAEIEAEVWKIIGSKKRVVIVLKF